MLDSNFKNGGVVARLHKLLTPLSDHLTSILMGGRDGLSHAPIVMRNAHRSIDDLYQYLEKHGIQCKTLWQSSNPAQGV